VHPELLGPLPSYGAFVVLGAALAIVSAVRRAERYRVARFDVLSAGLLAFGGGVVGATALYVLIHLPSFLADPRLLGRPGHVFYGGLVSGGLAALLYCRAYRVSLGAVADAGAPGLAFGHAIGRVGCLLGGCCYGRPVDAGFPLGIELAGARRHPVQLYEAIGLVLLGVMLSVGRPAGAGRPTRCCASAPSTCGAMTSSEASRVYSPRRSGSPRSRFPCRRSCSCA
jgi:phosphatidylglycerol---prolipoprotein diacylglyceryl transferase